MENNKVFCSQCGKEIKSTEKFCTTCGKENIKFSDSIAIVESVPRKNNKMFVGIAALVAIILVIALIAPKIYALISPTGFVEKAISSTFKVLEKENKSFDDIPTLTSIFSDTEGNTEKELYLKVDGVNGDALDMLVDTSMFEGYGLNLKVQTNKDNTAGNVNLAIMEGKTDIVRGNIYADKKLIALEVPKLFEDILAVKIDENEDSNDSVNDSDMDEFNSAMDMFAQMVESSDKLEKVYKDLSIEYSMKLYDLAKFEKDKNDKSLYTATISGDELIAILTDFSTELLSNEDFKEYYASTMYMSDGYNSKEYYMDMIDNMVLSLPDEIDYMLEEVEVGDILVTVRVENKLMKSMEASFNAIVNDETFKLKYIMNYIDEKDKKGIDFSLKFGVSSYDSIEGSFIYSKVDKDIIRDVSVDLKVAELDGIIKFDYKDSVKPDKIYESSLLCNIDDSYSNMKIAYDSKGSYNKDRIDYEKIAIGLVVDEEAINLNLSGYASNSKIKSIYSVDTNKVVYIEDYEEQDFNDLYDEIMKNFYLIMKSFGGIV